MRSLFALLIICTSCASSAQATTLRPGDAFEIVRAYNTQNSTSDGSSNGTSGGSDAMVVRVVSIDGDGTVFELDHPTSTSEQDRQRDWTLPARIVRPPSGPTRLLNADELNARLDDWLARANWTREQCGRWIFTWNAFKIECDPASAVAAFDEWFPHGPTANEPYSHPLARIAVPLVESSTTSTNYSLAAELIIDPVRVRAGQAEQDAVFRELSGANPPAIPDRKRTNDAISGIITVAFDVATDGGHWQRTIVTRVETKRPDGVIETDTQRTTLTRTRVNSR